MKTCNECGETKPLSEFQKCARNSDGHHGKCIPCKRAYDNGHYARTSTRKAEIRASNVRIRAAIIAWLREYLQSHPCVDCGESDIVVLQFDHQRDKVRAVSSLIRNNSLKNVQLEVAKCLVRCANCHTRKTARDFGWWRTT